MAAAVITRLPALDDADLADIIAGRPEAEALEVLLALCSPVCSFLVALLRPFTLPLLVQVNTRCNFSLRKVSAVFVMTASRK